MFAFGGKKHDITIKKSGLGIDSDVQYLPRFYRDWSDHTDHA